MAIDAEPSARYQAFLAKIAGHVGYYLPEVPVEKRVTWSINFVQAMDDSDEPLPRDDAAALWAAALIAATIEADECNPPT